MQIYKLDAYGETHSISLEKGNYLADQSLAVQMIDFVNGCPKPFSTLTVYLEEAMSLLKQSGPNCAFLNIDIGNDEDILRWVIKNKIATPLGFSYKKGLCEYPAVRFNSKVFNN